MPDLRKNQFLWIFVIINIIGLFIIGIIVFTQTATILSNIKSVSNEVQTKLDNTNELLTKLNSNIQGLDQLNQQIASIKEDTGFIEKSISTLPNNTRSLSQVQTNLFEVKQELKTLTEIYPPNQTIVLNNVNEDNLNTMINNAVDLEFKKIELKTNFNFILNIIFGSLLSIGFAIYLIVNKKKSSNT
ncbi:MAG: hypothetical protein QT04_C0050G0026 [archaeon GW2011_AR11]|nr:MAG: hypothetical protein QT04_C0050G0026 [archaeon GW2011_AR11]